MRGYHYNVSSATLTQTAIELFCQSLHQPVHVTHIHLPGWWKDGESLAPDQLLDFVAVVRQAALSNEGPITVHCR